MKQSFYLAAIFFVFLSPAFAQPIATITSDTVICRGESVILTASGGDTYLWSTSETAPSITVSPTSGITYSVTVTDLTGSDTVEVNVFVSSPVSQRLTPGVLEACEGDPTLTTIGIQTSVFTNSIDTVFGNSNVFPNWAPIPGRPFVDGACCSVEDPPYDVIFFQVDSTGDYDIHHIQDGWDGIIYIYTDPLNFQLSPPTTYVAGNDDSADIVVGVSYLAGVELVEGQNYYLITTGFETTFFGDYTAIFSGVGNVFQPGNINVVDLVEEFVVTDSFGTIVSIGADLSDDQLFTGSVNGTAYQLCAVMYDSARVDLTTYLGSTVANIDAELCAATSDTCYTVVLFPSAPTIQLVGDTVCDGTSGTASVFTNAINVSYEWNTGAISSSISLTPTQTTSYSVTVTDTIGCMASGVTEIQVRNSEGGMIAPRTVRQCAGSQLLDLGIQVEFTETFSPVVPPQFFGNTTTNLTWAPLSGRPFANGTCCSGNNPPYDVRSFRVSQTGSYDINQFNGGYDGYILLYEDPLDLTVSPPITLIAGNDDSAGVTGSDPALIGIPLNAGETYYLVSTGFNTIDFGAYSTTITGPGDLMLFGPPDTIQFGYEYAVTDPSGTIIGFSDGNLSDQSTYPGAVGGDTLTLCGVSYVAGQFDGASYIGQPLADLIGLSCVELSSGCVTAIIDQAPEPDAGMDQFLCSADSTTLSARVSSFSGMWTLLSGNGTIVSPTNPITEVIGLGLGANVFEWREDNQAGCIKADTIEVVFSQGLSAVIGNDTICRGDTSSLSGPFGFDYLWSTGDTSRSISISPLNSTTYKLTISDGSGCLASDSAVIFVRDLPIANIGGADTVCSGSTVTLIASGGTTYLWSTGQVLPSVQIVPAGFVNISLVAIDQFGCRDADSVTIGELQNPTVQVADQTACPEQAATFSTTNTWSTYLWSTGDATATTTTNISGSVAVSITDSNGCEGSDTAVLFNFVPAVVDVSGPDTVCQGDNATLTAFGGAGVSYLWENGDTTPQTTVSPIVGEFYSVTITDLNGCEIPDSISVEEFNPPLATVSGDDTICIGQTKILSGGGALNLQWSTGETSSTIVVSPTVTTNYGITVTDNNGCTDNDGVTIIVQDLPTVVFDLNDTLFCNTLDSVQLTATPLGGTFSGPAVTGSVFSPLLSDEGFHLLIYAFTDAAGCSAVDSQFVTVEVCPGIRSIDELGSLKVYPNPFDNTTTVSFKLDRAGTLDLKVVDLTGKELYIDTYQDLSIGGHDINLDATNWPSGVLLIYLEMEGAKSVVRVVHTH